MGRLIEEAEIYKRLRPILNNGNLDDVMLDLPTVEAIPKADYEARLKADMVAMLTDIQLEIEEMDSREHECDFATQWCIDRDIVVEIIQQKIDKLKAEQEGEE